ncbi:MAG TPA: acetate/propionate family kinase [Candidatus Binatia bacterium]|nr:acetate/propionate family kinase [Candidatus Binatia bacterium]
MNILSLNAGSSTLKFDLYAVDEPRPAGGGDLARRAGGVVERLGTPEAALVVTGPDGPPRSEPVPGASAARATALVLDRLGAMAGGGSGGPVVDAIGCRVVHGGDRFSEATVVTADVVAAVRDLGALAPLHNPLDADVLEACRRREPPVPVVAVFDTAFHRSLPEVARLYAVPLDLAGEHKLRRYGFHGIAHGQVSAQLLTLLGVRGAASRAVTCHLGNGASLCAVRGGRSVDTTMGLTPMEGLVMGTRSGDVDPGLVLHLLRALGKTADEVDDLLNRKSGLLGLSGRSADVRDLERAAAGGDARAELALDVFAYRAAKGVGAYAAALEGLDAIAFSGGIGEHSAGMRRRICRRLSFLGLGLDDARNVQALAARPTRISADGARVEAWVIPADENAEIARETRGILRRS